MYPKNNSLRKKKLTMEIFGIAITTTNKTGIIIYSVLLLNIQV